MTTEGPTKPRRRRAQVRYDIGPDEARVFQEHFPEDPYTPFLVAATSVGAVDSRIIPTAHAEKLADGLPFNRQTRALMARLRNSGSETRKLLPWRDLLVFLFHPSAVEIDELILLREVLSNDPFLVRTRKLQEALGGELTAEHCGLLLELLEDFTGDLDDPGKLKTQLEKSAANLENTGGRAIGAKGARRLTGPLEQRGE